jgi:uncharacterized protein (TIGR03086 family)
MPSPQAADTAGGYPGGDTAAYRLGDTPTAAVKSRVRCAWSRKPSRTATSAQEIDSPPAAASAASSSRYRRITFFGDSPMCSAEKPLQRPNSDAGAGGQLLHPTDGPVACDQGRGGHRRRRACGHHILAWVRIFANGAAGNEQPEDPDSYHSEQRAADFREAAATAVKAYAELPDDAPVSLSSGSMPAAASVTMMTGEYLAHGWDLAKATGQSVEYTDEEAEVARIGLSPLLSPEYRGPGMPFGDIVEVPDDSPALDRFLGFSGRDPHWRPAS